jgi:hypothetical protein
MAMGLVVYSDTPSLNHPAWRLYWLDFKDGPRFLFEVGAGIVSAALTFFWFQRRKSN